MATTTETLPRTQAAEAKTGVPVNRVDGRAKVTGAATYAGEFSP